MVLSFPLPCTLLASEISSLPALPTSIPAPEKGFNLTQIIKSKHLLPSFLAWPDSTCRHLGDNCVRRAWGSC